LFTDASEIVSTDLPNNLKALMKFRDLHPALNQKKKLSKYCNYSVVKALLFIKKYRRVIE
jgi:hypothetical protein